jgi:DNA replication protein
MTIKQSIHWLTKGNVSIPRVLLEHYKQLGINESEMMLLIHLHALAGEGERFPSLESLRLRMSCSEEQLTRMFYRLHKERFIAIESSKDSQDMVIEFFSLEPLWIKLLTFLQNDARQETAATWMENTEEASQEIEGKLFKRFEQELGRPLSPIEGETINVWLDQDRYTPQLILLALKESVIAGKLSLKYIDRILYDWNKRNIKTAEDVERHTKKFRSQTRQSEGSNREKKADFPFYNWLEN